MMPRTPGSDAVDLLTTARGTLVAATRPDDLAAATAYAAVAQAEALARIADAIDDALCVLAGIRDRMPRSQDGGGDGRPPVNAELTPSHPKAVQS